MTDSDLDEMERVSLCEAIDRVLNKGAVVMGDLMISVADIDLVYLGLRLVLTSIETARESLMKPDVKEVTSLGPRGVESGCGMESRNAND
jgi:hypothetical protein